MLFEMGVPLGVTLGRVAFFAPGVGDQVLSNLISNTALSKVPCRVFADREKAIAWLLAD
jgi:hypothetical protein